MSFIKLNSVNFSNNFHITIGYCSFYLVDFKIDNFIFNKIADFNVSL